LSAKKAAGKGRGLEEFRAAHDKSFIVPGKIRDGLAALGESWEYESEFMKRCTLSNTDIAAYREQFADFYVETPGRNPKRVWAGSKRFAAKLRERLG
jgi:hypothetical protein